MIAKLYVFALGTTATLSGAVAVTTRHYDLSRTGVNQAETILNARNVNVTQFGKLFSRTVDGQIYAQPLYVPNVGIPGQGTHNVVYLGSQNNNVYAFDADFPAASSPLWQVNLGPPLPSTVVNATRDILPRIGITS